MNARLRKPTPRTTRVRLPRRVARATRAAPPRARAASPAYTSWPALNEAIANLPHYQAGTTHWVVENRGGWGATDLSTGTIYISPTAPVDKLYSIAAHEYSHALTLRLYNGAAAATQAADAYFSQSGEYGLEIEADCMARAQGATWTNYTPCNDAHWRAGAATLLAGHRLR